MQSYACLHSSFERFFPHSLSSCCVGFFSITCFQVITKLLLSFPSSVMSVGRRRTEISSQFSKWVFSDFLMGTEISFHHFAHQSSLTREIVCDGLEHIWNCMVQLGIRPRARNSKSQDPSGVTWLFRCKNMFWAALPALFGRVYSQETLRDGLIPAISHWMSLVFLPCVFSRSRAF